VLGAVYFLKVIIGISITESQPENESTLTFSTKFSFIFSLNAFSFSERMFSSTLNLVNPQAWLDPPAWSTHCCFLMFFFFR
jgi:hypothetical protein